MTQKARNFQIAAWLLSLTVCVVALVAWGRDYGWDLSTLSAYSLFPLLGLTAFSIMWSHYINGTLRDLLGLDGKLLDAYYKLTGYLVLALICLHPGILIYSRFRDGYGLPPHSYESYVKPGLGWITLLGTASLLVFLAYELHRVYSKRKWWHFVEEAGDVAMLAIMYHGLRLGTQLTHQGWFRDVWLFYFVTLVAVLVRSYYNKFSRPKPATK